MGWLKWRIPDRLHVPHHYLMKNITHTVFVLENKRSTPLTSKLLLELRLKKVEHKNNGVTITIEVEKCRIEVNGHSKDSTICPLYRAETTLYRRDSGVPVSILFPPSTLPQTKKILRSMYESLQFRFHSEVSKIHESMGVIVSNFHKNSKRYTRKYINFDSLETPWKSGQVLASKGSCYKVQMLPWCQTLFTDDSFLMSTEWGEADIHRITDLSVMHRTFSEEEKEFFIPVKKRAAAQKHSKLKKPSHVVDTSTIQNGQLTGVKIQELLESSQYDDNYKRQTILNLALHADIKSQRVLLQLITDGRIDRKYQLQAIIALYSLEIPPQDFLIQGLMDSSLHSSQFDNLNAAMLYAVGGLAHKYPTLKIANILKEAFDIQSAPLEKAALIEALGNSRDQDSLQKIVDEIDCIENLDTDICEALGSALRHGKNISMKNELKQLVQVGMKSSSKIMLQALTSLNQYSLNNEDANFIFIQTGKRQLSYAVRDALLTITEKLPPSTKRQAILRRLLEQSSEVNLRKQITKLLQSSSP